MLAGVPTNFKLTAGKLELSQGADKAFDRLWFLANFDRLRIYTPDFNPGFSVLIQKSSSYLVQYRTLILGNFYKLAVKYVPELEIESADIVAFRDRKQYGIVVQSKFEPAEDERLTVLFLG